MSDPVNDKRVALSTLVILGLAAFAGLLYELVDTSVHGYWRAEYDHGYELLILYEDGRYTQQVNYKPGKSYTIRGHWHSQDEGFRQWRIQLQDAYDPMSPDGCDLEEPPHQGERDLHAVKEWTDIFLEPCPGNSAHRFESLPPEATRMIFLK